MSDFTVLKVYSDLFSSNILFLFCVTKLTDVQVFKITSKDFIGRVIFVSPKGIEIEFFPKVLKLSSESLLETGKVKSLWSTISYPTILQSLTKAFLKIFFFYCF